MSAPEQPLQLPRATSLRPRLRVGLMLLLYMVLALLPLALAAAQGLPRRAWLDELASGLAITAFAALLLEFLLSGRYRAISAGIGMDLTMRFHQMMALIATALLLLHPLLYRLPNATPLLWDATRQYSTGLSTAATLTGLAAWLLLPILVCLALVRSHLRFSYEAWRVAHGIGALAIAAFGTHHILDAGRYAQHGVLRVFWLLALSFAVASLAHTYLWRPLHQRRHAYRVGGVRPVAERLWQLELEPATAARLRFAAGQFVWLKFERALGRVTEHPFSIASAPAQLPRLTFLIKQSGDFTDKLDRLEPGTPAFVDGPYGNCTLTGRAGERIVLIAGGVGIAPLLSIARELAATHDPRPVTLLYADRNLSQLALRDELDALARAPNFDVHYLLQDPPPDWTGLRGIMDQSNLSHVVPAAGARRCLFFVCGPPAMIDNVELALARFGVPLAQIVSERFHYATGVVTPRERLTRAVIAGVVAVQLLAVLGFALI